MKKRKSPWPIVIFLFLCATLFGLAITLDIVRKEGWEGLLNRKRSVLQSTHPEAGPMLDRAEEKLR